MLPNFPERWDLGFILQGKSNMRSKRLLILATISVVTLWVAQGARGDVIIYSGAGHVQPSENVLFNRPGGISGPAFTVTGGTQSGLIIDLSSNENLITPSGGQARVESADGNSSTLTITPNSANPDLAFTELEFNVNSENGETGVLQLDFVGIGFAPFSTTIDLNGLPLGLGNGSNFIGIEAINGQFITSVTLTSLQGISSSPIIEDVRQIRISGETLTPDSGPLPNLPEPASLVIWCMSGLGLVAARWARTRSSAGAPTVGAAS